jgi:two-component system sensor histidine kinase DesK
MSTYNKNKEDRLQGQLEDANKRISELVKLEERQRIARDLHDTLGQKLSLIGLKSELAGKLINKNPRQAAIEISDVHQTARTALKEVRELVTQMRGTKLEDELHRIKQILMAAQIDFELTGDPKLMNTSLIDESVISMCVKEAVTNVVKHSQADTCAMIIQPEKNEIVVTIRDNGIGLIDAAGCLRGNGIRGMKERLEFVNGSLDIVSDQGTTVVMKVPNSYKRQEREES